MLPAGTTVALGAAVLHVACLKHGQVVRDAPPRPSA
jgi:hypothetical protein